MAYQNNNDNTVQTRGINVTSDTKAETPILMLVAYQNDMVKISMCGELPASQQTESRRFDRKNPIITCISREKCHALVEAYEKEIEPMLEGKQPMDEQSVSITVANVNQIALAVAKTKDGDWQTELRLIKGIDPETLICHNVTRFVFPKGEYIVGYKPDTGEFTERVINHNGIKIFVDDMKTFQRAASKAYVHAARCVDKAYKDMVFDAIVQIGNKVGAEIKQYGSTGAAHYGNAQNIFDKGESISSMPTMTLDELEQQLAGSDFMNAPSDDDELPFQ